MIHERQRLALDLEAGDHLAGVHARLKNFQGNRAGDRLPLLGHEDNAEASLADQFQQFIRTDLRADTLADNHMTDALQFFGWRFKKVWVPVVDAEQGLQSCQQDPIASAGLLYVKEASLRRLYLVCLVENGGFIKRSHGQLNPRSRRSDRTLSPLQCEIPNEFFHKLFVNPAVKVGLFLSLQERWVLLVAIF